MKTFFYSLLVALWTIFGLSSCVSDTPDSPVDSKNPSIRIKINSNAMTRDGESSEKLEDKISTLHLAFFNDDSFVSLIKATINESTNEITANLPSDPFGKPKVNRMIAFANLSENDLTDISNLEGINLKTIGQLSSEMGFAMSSAKYFGVNNSEILFSEITETNYSGEDPASVQIYLDRLAAKVKVSEKEGFSSTVNSYKDPNGNLLNLNLELTGWTISGTETSTYLIRQLADNHTPSDLNWINNAGSHTSHWAKSVSHGNNNFPNFGSQITITEPTYPLAYAKFSEATNTFSKENYFHETTVSVSNIPNLNACPSIVITGKYKIGNADAQTFYRFGEIIYTEDEYWDAMASSQSLIYKNNQKIKGSDLKNIAETVHLSSIADKAEALVTIQVNNITDLTKKDGTALSDTEINAYFATNGIYMEKFEGGKCFFLVPIKHKGYQDGVETQGEGAYGLVRNHSYSITIEGISGIGTGVASVNDYMIRSAIDFDKPSYTVKTSIMVNNWSEVDEQKVTL